MTEHATGTVVTDAGDLRVGVILLPDIAWPEAAQLWQRCETMGYDTLWTYDHLTWRSMQDDPWFAALPLLSAVAAITTRARIGTMVASPNYRHPVTFAKELLTLDAVSGGRLTVGLGSGGTGWDATALGQQPVSRGERTQRFVEFVEHLDVLLSERAVARLDGRFYAAEDARCIPPSAQGRRAPFAIGASGKRGIELAVRHGQTWITLGDAVLGHWQPLDEAEPILRAQMNAVNEECERQGRVRDSLSRLLVVGENALPALSSPDTARQLFARVAGWGFTDIALHRPRTGDPFRGDAERFDAALSEVLAHLCVN